MSFKELLNKYIKELKCTSKDLANEAGLSQTVISRYKSGERIPKNDEQLEKIANALAKIGNTKNLNFNKNEIFNSFINSLKNNFDFVSFSTNLNILIKLFNINTNDLAKYLSFDASHISRIKNGKSKPSDPFEFSVKVCNYIAEKYKSQKDLDMIKNMINDKDLNQENVQSKLLEWLTKKNINEEIEINKFLNNLNDFDLNDYINAIKFDRLKVINIPFYKGKTKSYYGINEMKQGELDFFKTVILSKNSKKIFMCSDMPMEDMAKDLDFGKKWMLAIAMCLKKELNLEIIHDLNRPFNEMMLGLESWIPIYMTGLVSPFYLKNENNSLYKHLNYVSDNVALVGECIDNHHDNGKYYLTNKKNEVSYYKQKCQLILNKACSLMDIYNIEKKKDFDLFRKKESYAKGDRKRILSSLPFYTLNKELLLEILNDNNINQTDTKLILSHFNEEQKFITNQLKDNKLEDNIHIINESDFDDNISYLNLSNMFYHKKIFYNYNQYLQHLKLTKVFAKNTDNYSLVINQNKTFNNITIIINKSHYVIISKDSNPVIHFVIRHPKLVKSIENFYPIVKE